MESVTNSAWSMATPCSRSASSFRTPTRWSATFMPVGDSVNKEAESRSYGTPACASRACASRRSVAVATTILVPWALWRRMRSTVAGRIQEWSLPIRFPNAAASPE